MEKRLIIAIDGYSSCGKSTFARMIARELNYIFIDSGAMYRAVTLYCIRRKFISGQGLNTRGILEELKDINIDFIYNPDINTHETFMNSENVEAEIRNMEVTSYVSRISQIPEVRARMVELQRQIGAFKGIVMDGRDIGTVVFPDADLKIFMTAAADIRARRRYDELKAKGINIDFEEIKRGIIARDIADENRDISPLRRADDAIVLDNSRMTVDAQMQWVREIIEKKINAGRN
ncbi:MAG: cytidylate kinase [Bacteroidetes bacterium GWE2_41_25]|nr:MAG: cytidylate kinase [Bacteroidetes bacterium GWA2_40_15]OFX97098.1 MAG: cytidylate kinase [Bacteroidetes bacterium GWC2_40_22]OFY08658.1 MAG: cytidylate kinase [Bacteroidetes bacterium GWE2_41_25]OFY60599.1 MAG: cytidylate kinase [Bacteroidetes bacterium GWF2_41_9]HAM10293.1 (d)CMP kinase [Bacteroidales bacterium]